MKRFLKYALLTPVLLVLSIVGALAFVAATETGTHAAWNMAQGFLPEGLKIAAVEGRLLGPLSVREVDYRTDAFDLSVREVKLRWMPEDLWQTRTLNVDLIAVSGVRYTQLRAGPEPEEKESGPTKLPKEIDLPVDVRLSELRLRDVEYRPAGNAEPVVLRRAHLSAAYLGNQLEISRLEIDAPLLSLGGRTRIDTHGAYPLDATFEWEARPPGYPAAKGRTALDGNLRRAVRVDQTVEAPYGAQATVAVNEPLNKPTFDARLRLEQLELRAIDRKLPPLTLKVTAKAAGAPYNVEFDTEAAVREPRYGTLNVALVGAFANQIVTIDQLALSSPEQPARLNASGAVALGGDQPKVDVQARWQELRWPLSGAAQFTSPQGSLDVDGTLNAVRAQLMGAVGGAALAQAGVKDSSALEANFRGGFTEETLEIEELSVAFAEQRLAAQGQIDLKGDAPALNVEARWQDLRWPLAGKALVTSAGGSVLIKGTPEKLDAQVEAGLGEEGRIEVDAKRAGENIELALNWRALRWPLTGEAQVRSSEGSLELSGTLQELRAQVSATLAGPALSAAGVKEQRLNASFNGGLKDQTLTIGVFKLGLAGQPAQLTAAGQVGFQDQPAFDLDIGWMQLRWPLAGPAQVQSPMGSLTVVGPLADARARLAADLSGVALAQAGVKGEQKLAVAIDGGFEAQVLTIERLTAAFMQQRLVGEGLVSLQAPQPKFDVQTRWQQLRWPFAGAPLMTSPQGEVAVKGTPENLRADVNVSVGADGRIEGSAERVGERIDIALDWRELQWPLDQPQVVSPVGELMIAGPLKDYQVQLASQVNAPDVTGARIDVAGRGSLEFLELTRIDVETLNGAITGDARVAWKPALQGRVALNAEGLNPGELLADWPGKLGFTLRAEVGMKGNQLLARFEELTVEGRLRSYPVQVDASGVYDAVGLKLDRLAVASGDSELSANGLIGETLDVDWRIESPDLGQLLPHAAGKLSGAGSAQGPLRRPRAQAHVRGSDLRYETFGVRRLDLDADVDVSGERQSQLSFELKNGQAGDIALKRIGLTGEGKPAAHTFELVARTSSGNADVALDGQLENPWQPDRRWQFELNEATLKYPRVAAWRLPAPITGMLSAARAQISRGCWASGAARLCVQVERTTAGTNAAVDINDLALSYFARLLPPETRIDGGLNGQAEINLPSQGPPAAQVRLMTTAGRVASVITSRTAAEGDALVGRVASQARTLLEFRPSEVDFAMGSGGLRLAAGLNLAQAGGIEISARVPEGTQPLVQRPLEGRITADVPDLSFLSELAPDAGRFQGRLEGEMRLTGTPAAPQMRGRLAVVDSSAVLNVAGLRLRDIKVEIIGQGAELQLAAAARSGGGTLNVDGQIQPAGDQAPRADIRIRGVAFQAFNTPIARVFVSPDLTVKADARRIDVTGEVRVPRAEITPKELPESAVAVSDDEVIVHPGEDEAQTIDDTGVDVYARVRLIVGADSNDEIGEQITDRLDEPEVYIDAFGLTAGIEGELLIIEEPGEPTRGTGELNIVEGAYQAYGQNLVIETGRILFPGGPISEPGLDVRAVRGDLEDEDVIVGVQVRGSLKRPTFELFSQPPMPQQVQLSYLVLGRAPGDTSGGESSLLARAALALGLKGGNYLAENFGSKLGVDEIGFESSDAGEGDGEQASLVIGKYLSPKLYISYGIGLLEPISTVRLEYAITNSLELVTESSGSQTGGDVIYTIERGQ